MQIGLRIWRCISTICPRNTTLTGYRTSDAATISSLRRLHYTKHCRRAMYGLSTHGKLISSSSPSTCPATSALWTASPPSDMHALFWHPRFNTSPPSCRSGIGVSALTTSSSRLTISELAFMPWFEHKPPKFSCQIISAFRKCFLWSFLVGFCVLSEGRCSHRRRDTRVPKEIYHTADLRRQTPTSMSRRGEHLDSPIRLPRQGAVNHRFSPGERPAGYLGVLQRQNGGPSQEH